MLKVYVAGSSDELDRAEQVIARLRAAGITVTSTWAENIRKVGASNPRDASREQRGHWSHVCLSEVDAAQVVLFLAPGRGHGRGGYYEVGYANAKGKHLLASGDTVQSIFLALGREFETDHEAIRYLVDLARRTDYSASCTWGRAIASSPAVEPNPPHLQLSPRQAGSLGTICPHGRYERRCVECGAPPLDAAVDDRRVLIPDPPPTETYATTETLTEAGRDFIATRAAAVCERCAWPVAECICPAFPPPSRALDKAGG